MNGIDLPPEVVIKSTDFLNSECHEYSSDELCHYTSIISLYHIIDGSSLRLSDIHFMNDPDDGRFFLNHLIRFLESLLINHLGFSERDIEKNLLDTDKPVWSESHYLINSEEENKMFLYFYKLLIIRNYGVGQNIGFGNQSFVFSLSTKEEEFDLPQWRAYGNNASGVRINFASKNFINSIKNQSKNVRNHDLTRLFSCQYLNLKSMDEIIIRLLGFMKWSFQKSTGKPLIHFFSMIESIVNIISLTIKNPHYESEGEVRIVVSRVMSSVSNIEFHPKNNTILPYVNLNFNVIDSISGVIVGSRVSEIDFNSIQMFCAAKSGGAFSVSRSKIRYRA